MFLLSLFDLTPSPLSVDGEGATGVRFEGDRLPMWCTNLLMTFSVGWRSSTLRQRRIRFRRRGMGVIFDALAAHGLTKIDDYDIN